MDIRANEEEVVHLSAKANFKSLGPRLGKHMRAAAGKLAELTFEQIQALREGEHLALALDGVDQVDRGRFPSSCCGGIPSSRSIPRASATRLK